MNDFETWWHNEGSAPPLPGEDGEEHCKRMCQIAWSNGAFKSREACAQLADEYATWGGSNFFDWFKKLAAAIRAGGDDEL